MISVLEARADPALDRVLPVVTGLLATVLALRPAEVTPEARILDDLGAESIDLLDLRFRIEDTLGLKISAQGFVEACGPGLSASQFRDTFTVRALAAHLASLLGAGG